MTHVYTWNAETRGHQCRECGAIRPTATPAQNLRASDTRDMWERATPGANVWQSVSSDGAPIFHMVLGTAQGSAEYRAILDRDGDTVAEGYMINMRPVDSVPAKFRKYHSTITVASYEAMREYARAVWAVNIAEHDTTECGA